MSTLITPRAGRSAVALLVAVALWAGVLVGGATPAYAVPAATNVRAAAVTDRTVTVAWDAPVPGTDVVGYRVLRDGHDVGRTQPGVLTFTDRGLNVATEYRYSVVAEAPPGQNQYESLPG
ncbi:fibronectin type III domain-containing protein [Streptomyces sp. NPDC047315]|uniref:fibronectin type III domain-containing protein n=1 Tax=Streptomyces sp. NPDC047315 TaxID=3155142 RepID=UPI0033CA5B93